MSLRFQTHPPCPIFSPTPKATRSNWRSNSRLVMTISEEEEEKNWDNKKALFSSPIKWEQMISHSLLFAATGASLTINPSENLVSLGVLHVWPRCGWGCQMAAPPQVAVLHASASPRQRGGGREYCFKWDKKIGEGESPSFTPCGFPLSPQTCLVLILVVSFVLKLHLLLYP